MGQRKSESGRIQSRGGWNERKDLQLVDPDWQVDPGSGGGSDRDGLSAAADSDVGKSVLNPLAEDGWRVVGRRLLSIPAHENGRSGGIHQQARNALRHDVDRILTIRCRQWIYQSHRLTIV